MKDDYDLEAFKTDIHQLKRWSDFVMVKYSYLFIGCHIFKETNLAVRVCFPNRNDDIIFRCYINSRTRENYKWFFLVLSTEIPSRNIIVTMLQNVIQTQPKQKDKTVGAELSREIITFFESKKIFARTFHKKHVLNGDINHDWLDNS